MGPLPSSTSFPMTTPPPDSSIPGLDLLSGNNKNSLQQMNIKPVRLLTEDEIIQTPADNKPFDFPAPKYQNTHPAQQPKIPPLMSAPPLMNVPPPRFGNPAAKKFHLGAPGGQTLFPVKHNPNKDVVAALMNTLQPCKPEDIPLGQKNQSNIPGDSFSKEGDNNNQSFTCNNQMDNQFSQSFLGGQSSPNKQQFQPNNQSFPPLTSQSGNASTKPFLPNNNQGGPPPNNKLSFPSNQNSGPPFSFNNQPFKNQNFPPNNQNSNSPNHPFPSSGNFSPSKGIQPNLQGPPPGFQQRPNFSPRNQGGVPSKDSDFNKAPPNWPDGRSPNSSRPPLLPTPNAQGGFNRPGDNFRRNYSQDYPPPLLDQDGPPRNMNDGEFGDKKEMHSGPPGKNDDRSFGSYQNRFDGSRTSQSGFDRKEDEVNTHYQFPY